MTLTELLVEIIKINLPLAFFLLSILLSGGIIKLILFWQSIEDFKNFKLRFDGTTIIFGLITIFLSLWSLGFNSFENITVFLTFQLWIRIGIFTLAFAIVTRNYRLYGNKWVSDRLIEIIAFVLAITFTYLGISIIPIFFKFEEFTQCNLNILCFFKLLFKRLVQFVVVGLLFYGSFKLFKEVLKQKRYKNLTNIN